MTDASVADVDGCVMKLKESHGILFGPPLGLDKRYDELQQMESRDDDVIICGYPKCGTNWVWEVVTMLLRNSTEYMKGPKVAQMLEVEVVELDKIVDIPSPRTFNTHLPFGFLPPNSIRKKSKLIYLLRNPKDVAVSYYNHIRNMSIYEYTGTWEAYFRIFVEGTGEYGSYFKYMKQWQQDIHAHSELPILTVYYEDLKNDSMKEFQRLCVFLEITRDEKFLESVHEACSFKKLKDQKDVGMLKSIFRDGSSMFRKGDVGDWKNWFTVAQNETFDKIYEEEMKGFDMKFKYVLK